MSRAPTAFTRTWTRISILLVWRKHEGVLPVTCTRPHSILQGAVPSGMWMNGANTSWSLWAARSYSFGPLGSLQSKTNTKTAFSSAASLSRLHWELAGTLQLLLWLWGVPISHSAHLNPLMLQGAEATQISNSPLHLPEGLPFQCVLSRLSRVRLCATLRTVARQVPLSMGFSREEYWKRVPFSPPKDLPDPEILGNPFSGLEDAML